MAKPLLILLFIILLSHSSLSSARPLLDFALQNMDNGEPAAAAAYGIALPSDKVNSSEEEDDANNGEVSKVPCRDAKAPETIMKNSDKGIWVLSPRIPGKYRPLVLNLLPKGTVAPSGPSKGTNDVKN